MFGSRVVRRYDVGETAVVLDSPAISDAGQDGGRAEP